MYMRFMSIMTASLAFLIVVAFVGVIYNLYIYISLSQSKEFDYLKVDYTYWPLLSAGSLGFLLFPGLRRFAFLGDRVKAISITFTLFRLSPYVPEVTGDMYKK